MKKLSVLMVALILLVTTLSAMQETVLFEIPHGSGDGELRTNGDNWREIPGPFTMDEEGNFYICDFDNNRIQVFSKDGKFIRSIKTGRAYNGFIHYDNNKLFYSAIENNEYSVMCCDISSDSLSLYKQFPSKLVTNPIYTSFCIEGKLYLLIPDQNYSFDDDETKIYAINSAKYDTLIYNFTKDINMKGIKKGNLAIIGIYNKEIYFFYYYNEKNSEGTMTHFNKIIKTSGYQIKEVANKQWFNHFYSKPENFYISTSGEIYGLIPVLLKTHKGSLGYELLDEMKFQMIKYY